MNQKISYKLKKLLPRQFISLKEVKDYLRVIHEYDDQLIESHIRAAIDYFENFTGVNLLPREIEVKFILHNSQKVRLKFFPILELLNLIYHYKDKNSAISDYSIFSEKIFNIMGQDTIEIAKLPNNYDFLILTYISGVNEQNLPASIRYGLFLHIALIYDQANNANIGLPMEVKKFYLPYRAVRL